jgi:hypothetical protein
MGGATFPARNPRISSKLHILPAVVAGILCFGVGVSWSDEKIGGAETVINLVEGNLASGKQLPVVQGDSVFLNEAVRSGADSKARLLLNDNTNVTVGPGSTVKLDEFVYSGPKQPGTIAVNMTKGTLRFITGDASKRAYTILTPTAAIGVRGTILRIQATATETKVINEEGTAIVCLRKPDQKKVTVEEIRKRCRGREEEQRNLTESERKKRDCPCIALLLPNQEATISSSQVSVVQAPVNAISDPIINTGLAGGVGTGVAGGFSAPLGAAALAGTAVAAGTVGTVATSIAAARQPSGAPSLFSFPGGPLSP